MEAPPIDRGGVAMAPLRICVLTASKGRLLALGGVLAAVAAAIVLGTLIPPFAQASGCENSWTNTSGGSWFEGTNWSKKAIPTSTEEVCITEKGTYTVEATETSTTGSVTVKSLTVGGTEGTQTLAVASTGSLNAILATTSGLTVGSHGAVTLTNANSGTTTTLEGSISNGGIITSEAGAGGGVRQLQGNLTNTGTLNVNTGTKYNGASAALKNEGVINVANEKFLEVSNKGSVSNGTGGKIAGTGSGTVLIEPETAFTEGAGTTSGTKPVIVRDAALTYSGAGASAITARGESSTLTGASSAGQSLTIEGTSSENAKTTAASGFTNAGSITLTTNSATGATLVVSSGTLASSGTITSEAAGGGPRSLQGNLTNTGTLNVNTGTSTFTSYNGASAALKNEGAINVADKTGLVVTNKGSVTNGTGGKIAGTGSGAVFMEPETAFTEGAGTTSGTKPVIVDDGALTYSGAGASSITTRGESSTLSGASSAAQSLTIEGTSSENAKTTAASGFTNGGAITLTSNAGTGAAVVLTSGTLASSGTITSESSGTRQLIGNLTNTGTLNINTATKYNGAKAALKNEGALNIADKTFLEVSNEGSVTNGTGGKVAATGTGEVAMEPGTSFTEGTGTTSGTKPVIVRDAALTYSGAGASSITTRGESSTLSGASSSGQSLTIEGTSSENAKTTAASGFTNAGSIRLTSNAGTGAALVLTSGTLARSGTITSEAGAGGGVRQLQGNLTNTGTLSVNTGTKYNGPKAALKNEGALNVANEKFLEVSNEGSVSNGTGGKVAATGTGEVAIEPGTAFTEGAGTTSGTKPVIVRDASLTYSGAGASTITTRGESSTLSGAPSTGQSLTIEGTSSENAKTTATSGFTNAGSITLTSSAATAARLKLSGGTLTNSGTFRSELGGPRALEGNLLDEGLVSLGAGATLEVTGTYTQSKVATLAVANTGGGFGQLHVTGSTTLDGTLSVADEGGFSPAEGATFEVISGTGSVSGTFTGLAGPSGGLYSVKYEPHSVVLIANKPTVTEVSPNKGPEAGGTTVAITGTNLTGASAVSFGGVGAKSFKVNSAKSITAVSPAGSATVDVTVTTANGTSPTSAADHFTYLAAGHWFSNGTRIPTAQVVPLKVKGSATLAAFKTTLTCKVKGNMTIANSAGSGGTDSITALSFKCKLQNQASSSCPKPGKVQVRLEQIPWASRLTLVVPPTATDEILPGNPAASDLSVKCSTAGEEHFTGGFAPTVGQSVLEFGAGQPFTGSWQLTAPKHAHITAG
jgi:hypothetical protein